MWWCGGPGQSPARRDAADDRPKAKDKERDKLVRAAWDQGAWCKPGKSGYIKIFPENSTEMILVESSPSDFRGLANIKGRLRRAGIDGTPPELRRPIRPRAVRRHVCQERVLLHAAGVR